MRALVPVWAWWMCFQGGAISGTYLGLSRVSDAKRPQPDGDSREIEGIYPTPEMLVRVYDAEETISG